MQEAPKLPFTGESLEISIQELSALASNRPSADHWTLVDCREADEFLICQIEGSLELPLSQWAERYQELKEDDNIVIYCHHGMRSMRATQFLTDKGYRSVRSLKGGIEAWSLEIDSSLQRY